MELAAAVPVAAAAPSAEMLAHPFSIELLALDRVSPLFGYTLMRSNVCDFWAQILKNVPQTFADAVR